VQARVVLTACRLQHITTRLMGIHLFTLTWCREWLPDDTTADAAIVLGYALKRCVSRMIIASAWTGPVQQQQQHCFCGLNRQANGPCRRTPYVVCLCQGRHADSAAETASGRSCGTVSGGTVRPCIVTDHADKTVCVLGAQQQRGTGHNGHHLAGQSTQPALQWRPSG
jgi:hypothetical protein